MLSELEAISQLLSLSDRIEFKSASVMHKWSSADMGKTKNKSLETQAVAHVGLYKVDADTRA